MQDFPYFRMVEYARCISDGQFPCRWAANAGLGYGEPVFNFYSHIPFLLGGILANLGISVVSSLKFVFGFSLIGSAFAMYLLSRTVWKSDWAGVLSSILYLYAPYRAVNVWVRGALPESFAFIILPLILFCFEKYIQKEQKQWLVGFSISLSALLLTHNLSVLLFSMTISLWILLRLFIHHKLRLLLPICIASVLSVGLASFYLLPVITESSFVNLQTTTEGYFNFRAHFVTLEQIFLSRFWGYGGSTWGSEDGLSLAIGPVQWSMSLITGVYAMVLLWKKRRVSTNLLSVLFLVGSGFLYLLLMHNKSTPLWEMTASVSQYIQFPWRFLGIALFSFSFAGGFLVSTFNTLRSKFVFAASILTLVIGLNAPFFKEDYWISASDRELQSGERWVDQSRASIGDYWPKYGPIPTEYMTVPANTRLIEKGSQMQQYEVTNTTSGVVSFPVAYFPGWRAYLGQDEEISITPDVNGMISSTISEGSHTVRLVFTRTPVRVAGEIVSLASMCTFLAFLFVNKKKKHL